MQTESGERSLALPPQTYIDLPPAVGRNPENFFFLSPGVTGDTFNAHINGSQTLSREIQIDGLSAGDAEMRKVFGRCQSLCSLLFLALVIPAQASVRYTIFLFPGTPAEAAAITRNLGSSVEEKHTRRARAGGGVTSLAFPLAGVDLKRRAQTGGGWTYRIVVPPGAKCVLTFEVEGTPRINVTAWDGNRIASRIEKKGTEDAVYTATPVNQPLGGELRFQFRAVEAPIAVRKVKLTVVLSDRNRDGISDAVEIMMSQRPGERIEVSPRPDKPHTAFFFSDLYDPAMAMPTDAVQLYFWKASSDLAMYSTWAEKGYDVQTFLHSRYGRELRDRPEENQSDRNGNSLGVIEVMRDGKAIDLAVGALAEDLRSQMVKRHGEGITLAVTDYYKVPTRERIELARRYYAGPLTAGATAFCFDEPEIWAQAGYSESFKREWGARYGTPWQPPYTNVDARYKAEQLKGFLIRRWIEAILTDVQGRKPSATRMIAMHSPVNYYQIRMATPHHALVAIPALQEVVAEVWNVPFEVGYLEYSSFYHLLRGTGKRLWFMMDPLGDSPAASIEFYRHSYSENLLAALMFVGVDTYEPLIWPNRVYGHVPDDYETIVNTVTGALAEIWRYPNSEVKAGTKGIGTFIADSMGWQRAEPSPSDYSGFYGLSQPLLTRGIPVEVLSLDRAAEPGYLNQFKTLLLSYDFLKPSHPDLNESLASWVRHGGSLVVIGGTDAYNDVSEAWWRRAGYASPVEDLLARMGLSVRNPKVLSEPHQDIFLEAAGKTFDPHLARLRFPVGPLAGAQDYPRYLVQEVPHPALAESYPITLFTPPLQARALYRIAGEPAPPIWEAPVGRGTVIFAGIAPGYLKTTSGQGSDLVRALARYALEKAGSTYREQPFFLVRRGPYTAIRAMYEDYKVSGRFVNLFSPTLAVMENPTVAPNDGAFLKELGPATSAPRVVAVSGRLRARYEQADITSFLTQAPSKTEGAARLWAGNRHVTGLKAFTVLGASVRVTSHVDGDTVLLRYTNDADGVVVRVEWDSGKKDD